MDIVTTTQDLAKYCEAFAKKSHVAVDTEFMRESTYWPQLCLIQMASNGDEVIVDPLANGISLAPFFELMASRSVTKVFHAARQDVEIIYNLGKLIPAPLFDTQVAAMVAGFGDSIGYENIVRQVTGAHIDKTSRFTDWSRRPLTEKQLRYALSDVTHLRDVYAHLCNELDRTNRESWLAEEMDILTSPDTYFVHPENAWKRLKFRARNKRALAVFMAVAGWREAEAQERDVPRGRILKDDALVEIATQIPKDIEALGKLRAVPRGFAQSRQAKPLMQAIADGLARDHSELPEVRNGPGPAKPPGPLVDLLKVALKLVCEQNHVAPKLIANVADLEAIAISDTADVRALKGWRRKIFGDLALDIKHGRLAIAVEDGEAITVPRDGIAAKAAE
ncbi:MAG: ribonuclease D [Hyphomicrobiales bacterium]